MNDLVNLICVIIISIIIFYSIFKDNTVCENFEQFNCGGIIDKIIVDFFKKYKNKDLYNEKKINTYLENETYNKDSKIELESMRYNKKNIFGELKTRNLINSNNISDKDENINHKYVFDLLRREIEQTTDVIIKVIKQSETFEHGIIDIGKMVVNSN